MTALISLFCYLVLFSRECGNPINVLTGLDYWLDNLMCNVPEVAMCYHLDGIVQVHCVSWMLLMIKETKTL